MGIKVLIEVEVNYPDLSMHKHVDMLRAVFKQNKVYGVKTVKLLEPIGLFKFLHKEQIYPKQCRYCEGTGNQNVEGRGMDCEYCGGSGEI